MSHTTPLLPDNEEFAKKAKEYEGIGQKKDPMYDEWVLGIDFVKTFIRNKKLIIYGGSAIDYALRLYGDNIYPDSMLSVPDLDFFSPNSVTDAYELAKYLYDEGFGESRAIRALYVRAMKVDIGSKHFVADLAYCPQKIFDRLNYLEYDGMRIIHPFHQRIDTHSSLSFPYDSPPRESIFNRWKKDIERFWLMDKYYPIKDMYDVSDGPFESFKLAIVRIPYSVISKNVISGFAAFYLIYEYFRRIYGDSIKDIDRIIARFGGLSEWPQTSQLTEDGLVLEYLAPNKQLDIVSHKPLRTVAKIDHKGAKMYEPYFNIMPARINADCGDYTIAISSTKNRLLSVNSLTIGGNSSGESSNKSLGNSNNNSSDKSLGESSDKLRSRSVRIVNAQYLAIYMLSRALSNIGKIRNLYAAHYEFLMEMIKVAGLPENLHLLSGNPLGLSVEVYGSTNIGLDVEIALNNIHCDMFAQGLVDTPCEKYNLPRNYNVAISEKNGLPPPSIEGITDSPFFRESGEEVLAENHALIEHLF